MSEEVKKKIEQRQSLSDKLKGNKQLNIITKLNSKI